MRDAECVAVIPSMVKIAVGFGGGHGKGVVPCGTENGWSAPAPITITGGSWGLQLGGQAVDLVMIVTNDQECNICLRISSNSAPTRLRLQDRSVAMRVLTPIGRRKQKFSATREPEVCSRELIRTELPSFRTRTKLKSCMGTLNPPPIF